MVGIYFGSRKHGTWELRPKFAGRRAVQHLKGQYPEEFASQARLAAQDDGEVFRVAFQQRTNGLRQIRNLAAVINECKQWELLPGSRYKAVDCILLPDGTPDNHARLVAQVQHVHALVGTHGSGLTYAFFMPNGTGLVEILAWNFHGKGCTWADQYFSRWYEQDHTVESGYFRLVADKDHVFPGPYERRGVGSSYPRDADVEVFFPTLAEALRKIALGQLETTKRNRHERTFFMRQRDVCPGHADWLKDRGLDPVRRPLPPEVVQQGAGSYEEQAAQGTAGDLPMQWGRELRQARGAAEAGGSGREAGSTA